jgi:hypothetical protein
MLAKSLGSFKKIRIAIAAPAFADPDSRFRAEAQRTFPRRGATDKVARVSHFLHANMQYAAADQ